MAKWKIVLYSMILAYMLAASVVGTGALAFLYLEWRFTPKERDDRLPPPSRVDLAPELVPYTMFGPITDAVFRDVAMPASPEDNSPPTIEINQHGFRYGPLEKEKPADTLRLFMLGGSVVFYGHTNETTIAGYLEASLNEAFAPRPVEVVNAGVTGFISNQELVMLVTHVIDFQPDGVIVFDGFNDFLMPTSFEQRLGYPYKFKTLEVAWYQSTALLRRVSQLPLIDHLRAGSHFMRRFSPHWSYVNFLGDVGGSDIQQDAPVPTPEEMVENLIDNWRKMARFLMAHRKAGMFVLQPFNTERLPNVYRPQYDLVERVIPALNAEFAACDPPITFHSYRNVMDEHMHLFWDDIHTYDEGNRIYAELLQRDLHELR